MCICCCYTKEKLTWLYIFLSVKKRPDLPWEVWLRSKIFLGVFIVFEFEFWDWSTNFILGAKLLVDYGCFSGDLEAFEVFWWNLNLFSLLKFVCSRRHLCLYWVSFKKNLRKRAFSFFPIYTCFPTVTNFASFFNKPDICLQELKTIKCLLKWGRQNDRKAINCSSHLEN